MNYVRVTECVECGREEHLRQFLCHRCGITLGYATEEES